MPNQVLPKGWSELRRLLGFGNHDADLEHWLASDLFKPFWLRLYSSFIEPNQDRAEEISSLPDLDSDFHRVTRRLLEAQADQHSKYSHPLPDSSAWDNLDHLAFFLHHTVLINKDQRGGVFYQKNIWEDKMQYTIWQVLERMVYDHYPMRIRGSLGATLMGTRIHVPEAQRLQDAVTGMTMPGPVPQNLWGGVVRMTWNARWSDVIEPEKLLSLSRVFRQVKSLPSLSALRNKVRLEYNLHQQGEQLDTIQVFHDGDVSVLSPATWDYWRDLAAGSIGALNMVFTTRPLTKGEDFLVSSPHRVYS